MSENTTNTPNTSDGNVDAENQAGGLSQPRPAPQYGLYAPGYDATTTPQYGQSDAAQGQQGQQGQQGAYSASQHGQQTPQSDPYGAPVPAQQFSSQSGPVLPNGKTNTLSIISLVCGILSVVTFFQALGLPGIAAIITGHIGLSQIKKRGEQGRGMGIAGLVMGYVTAGFGVILLILGIVVVIMLMNNPDALNGLVPPSELDELRDQLDELNV